MSKKTNTNPEVLKEIMENQNLPESIKTSMLAKANAKLEAEATKATAEPKAKVPKAAKEPKEIKTVDITNLLEAMPATFTPALLDKLFQFNDGGKTVRRHLRNHFSEIMTHNHKDKWSFSKTESIDILQYFANRYVFNLEALKEEPKKETVTA